MELPAFFYLVLLACLLDAILGDPVYRLHPIRLLGLYSYSLEQLFFRLRLNGYLGGILHASLLLGSALCVYWGIRQGLAWLHPWAAWGWDLFIAYSLLCMRDLYAHGHKVCAVLHDMDQARSALSQLVGRDTKQLQQGGVVRATIESLSENLTDGVLTPLWALCIFGLPGLIMVKVISNLDSMVGYKNERYLRFGWAGARLDDLIHWLPARVSVPVIVLAATLLRLHPHLAWYAAWRYHAMLPSPNSGLSEAAFAGALRVRLLGPIYRYGVLVNSDYMGDAKWPSDLNAKHLQQALQLLLLCMVLAVIIGLSLLLIVSH